MLVPCTTLRYELRTMSPEASPLTDRRSVMQRKNRGRPPASPDDMLAAADRLFAQSELPGAVTMDAIALAASVGKGTLFRAFGSRDGLLDALWAARISALRESAESNTPPFEPGAAPADRLVSFLDAILTFKIANRHLIRARELSGGLLQSPHYQWMHAEIKSCITDAANPADADYATYNAHALLSGLHIDLIDEMLMQGLSLETIRKLQTARARNVLHPR